jgi:hypothetical protein
MLLAMIKTPRAVIKTPLAIKAFRLIMPQTFKFNRRMVWGRSGSTTDYRIWRLCRQQWFAFSLTILQTTARSNTRVIMNVMTGSCNMQIFKTAQGQLA